MVVEGGFSGGTAVLKGLALGATVVAVGRTVLWGLAADGAAGVACALDLLRPELRTTIALPRLAKHLEDAVDEIDDPVVGDAGPRVEASLVLPISPQARLRDLDDEHRMGRMPRTVVAGSSRHHRHVGLGLGFGVERDGPLSAHLPALAEGRPKRILRQPDRGEMRIALRLGGK